MVTGPASQVKSAGRPSRDEQAGLEGPRSERRCLGISLTRRRGEGSRMDSDIRAAVHKELVSDPRIDADDIVVEVFNGEVSLNGTVPSQVQCSEATVAAQRAAGVTAVHNLLAIALPSRDYGDDTALAQLVNQALAADRAVPD